MKAGSRRPRRQRHGVPHITSLDMAYRIVREYASGITPGGHTVVWNMATYQAAERFIRKHHIENARDDALRSVAHEGSPS